MPGPPPKRSDQRRRSNKPAAGTPTSAPGMDVVVPDADPDWHPVAVMWFESLKTSGQRVFYQNSDWALAYATAESMSRELHPQPLVIGSGPNATIEMHKMPPKAASLAAWLKAAAALLATEGDRRRVALELERPKGKTEEAASVSSLDSWRTRIDGTG